MRLNRMPDPDPTAGDPPAAEQVGALKSKLEAAQQRMDGYEALQKNVTSLFSPNASDEQREAALAAVMESGGIDAQDVNKMMGDITSQTEEQDPPGGLQEGETQQAVTEEQRRIMELEANQLAMQQQLRDDKKTASKEMLASSVKQALLTSPDAQSLINKLKNSRGEEHAEKVAGFLEKDAMRETLESLYARKAQVGSFDNKWIAEEATKAAQATLEKARALSASDPLGKAPGALDESVMLTEIAQKEVKIPQYDKEKSADENQQAAGNYTVARLQQIAAKHAANAAAGGETKA